MRDHLVRPDIFTTDFTQTILRHVGLADGSDLDIKPMPQGFGMALVRVRHAQFDLVIKQLSPARPLERIRFALQFQARLGIAGLPCPRLHQGPNGDFLVSSEKHLFCVQEWCPGEHFRPENAEIGEKRHHRQQLGALLGQAHAAVSPEWLATAPAPSLLPHDHIFTRLTDVERGLPWSRGGRLARNLWLLGHEPGAFGRQVRGVLPVLKAARSRLAASQLASHPQLADNLPVHGDFHFDNVLFLDGQVRGLLDFDNATIAPRAFDLGSALAVVCQEREHEDDFLSAYEAAGGGSLPDRDLLRACALARLVNSLGFQIVAYTRRQVRSPQQARHWISRLIHLLTVEIESG